MISEHQIILLVEQLERKIGLLKGVNDTTKRRVVELEKRNSSLQKANQEQLAELKQLRKKQDNLEKNVPKSKDLGKIVQNNLSGTDTNAELKQQLDEYIREIDRCIAHLSSLS